MELQLKGLHRYFLSTIFPANKDIILVLEIVDSPFVPSVGYLYKNIQRSSFSLIGTMKDWDKFSGIVGVSLSVGIQRQVAHGTFGIIAAHL